MLEGVISRHPSLGIFASIGGFITSIVSALQAASVVLGCAGAMLAVGAGYYTFRIQRRKWLDLNRRK